MAPLLRQRTTKNSAGLGTGSDGFIGSLSVATGQNVAAGTYMVLAVTMGGANGNVATVTDTRGNTWTRWTGATVDSYTDGDADTNIRIEIWTAVSNGAGANTITVTNTASASVLWGLFFSEYTGIATSSPQGAVGTVIEPGYVQGHAVTTATAATKDDLVIAVYANAHTNEVFTVGNGYTNLATTGSATGLLYLSAAIEDRIASTSGTQSANFNTTGYDKGCLAAVCLHPLITSAPAAPTDVTVTPGNATASLSWTASTGAASYTVRRGTSSSGPFTIQSTGVTDTFFSQTGLTNGTPYWFTVSAVNVVGESAQTAAPSVTPAVPQSAPFLDWFAYGSKPNLTTLAMRTAFRNKVNNWFTFVLTSELTAGTPIPQYARLPGPIKRIKAPDQGFYSPSDPSLFKRNGTVSEGQAYGTLFCAWLSNPQLEAGVYWADAKATAEALYRFYAQNVNDKGLMNWHILDTGAVGDYNGATDGDADMAEALRVLSELHGDGGSINFGLEAEKLMAAIQDFEFVPESGYAWPNLATNGDNWGYNTDSYMSDYFRVGYFREWSKWLAKRGKTARSQRWLRIIEANYDQIQYYIDDPTWSAGVPDRQTRTYGTIDGDFNNQISYNSVRLGFGMMTEFLWNGPSADPRGKQFMDKIAARFKTVFTTGGNVKAPNYSKDLSSFQGYSNLSGWGYVLSTALGATGNQTFTAEIINAIIASTEEKTSYFNGGIGCYSLGLASGAAQPFTTAAAAPGDPPPDPVVTPTSTDAVICYRDASNTKWVELSTKASV